ncbi:MAG: acyloxyacyl hydrolase [Verrucomicrobiales bacterium]|nr:acyloxyacyl hydrolase [Verrucomicrobiales bacterium]
MHNKHSHLLGMLLAAGALLSPLAANADTGAGKTGNMDVDKVVVSGTKAACSDKDWSLEFGSGAAFSNVRDSKLDGYTYVPIDLTASLKIDDVSLDDFCGGIFRGYTEFFFRGYWNQMVHSPAGENHMVGASFGPRYNFVQPGWKIVPFAEAGVGFGFLDSNPTYGPGGHTDNPHGMGQDFNFTFSVAIGARYDIDETWYLRVAAFYQHFSNAGLSEPYHDNRAIDAVGPELSVGARF